MAKFHVEITIFLFNMYYEIRFISVAFLRILPPGVAKRSSCGIYKKSSQRRYLIRLIVNTALICKSHNVEILYR